MTRLRSSALPLVLAAQRGVGAPRASTCGGEIQKREAEQDRQRAIIGERREQTARRMTEEIGERHQARQDKRRNPREESNGEQRAESEFEHARIPGRPLPGRHVCESGNGRKSENLGGAKLKDEQPDHNAEDAQEDRAVGGEKIFHDFHEIL